MIRYKIETTKLKDLSKSLEEQGKNDWELVYVSQDEKNLFIIYKKDVKQDGTIEFR